MTFTLVGAHTFELENVSGTQTETLPGTVLEDDIVLIAGCDDQTISTAVINTSGYTNIFRDAVGSSPGHFLSYKIMTSTPDTDIVLDETALGADFASCLIQVWRGVDTTTPQDVAATTATGGPSEPDPPSITTITDGCLIVAVGHLDDTNDEGGVSAPSGYTNLTDVDAATGGGGSTCMMASFAQTSFGAENPGNFTITGLDDTWAVATVALRPGTSVQDIQGGPRYDDGNH